MSPAPVRVKSDGARLARAAGSAGARALLPAQLGVGFGGLLADLLSSGSPEERESGEGKGLVHFDWRGQE